MTTWAFSLLIALGSAIGAAIATPNEERIAVIVFVVFNAIFAAIAFSVGRAVVGFFRNTPSLRL